MTIGHMGCWSPPCVARHTTAAFEKFYTVRGELVMILELMDFPQSCLFWWSRKSWWILQVNLFPLSSYFTGGQVVYFVDLESHHPSRHLLTSPLTGRQRQEHVGLRRPEGHRSTGEAFVRSPLSVNEQLLPGKNFIVNFVDPWSHRDTNCTSSRHQVKFFP